MEFREVVRHRRMVRNYTDEPVDRASIERIVDAGLRAPSAGFSQGQSMVVVTEESLRRRIAELANEPSYVAQGFDPWVSRAPVHIVLCTSEAVYRDRYRQPDKLGPDGDEIDWPVPYWWVDAGATMMMILLAAVDEGLAAGFLGTHAMPALADLLGIPDDVSPVGIITIGHPAPDRRSGSLARGRRTGTVHWNGWQR